MTDAELIETMFKRRIHEDTQARFDADYERRNVSRRAAGGEEAA